MITEQQRLERKNYIGSSDVGAIFNLDPFKSMSQVWASKVFDVEALKATEAMDRGNRHEDACVGFVKTKLNVRIETDPIKVEKFNPKFPLFKCHLDGYTLDPFIFDGDVLRDPAIVEAKTARFGGTWGEPGTDDAPKAVLLQVHQQMICSGIKNAVLVCLTSKHGLVEELYYVRENNLIRETIIAQCTKFWNEYVIPKKTPPESCAKDLEFFKRIIRQPDKIITLEPEVISAWDTARQTRIDDEKIEKELKAKVQSLLGDAEGSVMPDGRLLTFFTEKEKDLVDLNKLRIKYPEIYDEIATTGRTHRTMRIRKAQ